MNRRIKHAFVFDAFGTLFQLGPLEKKLGGVAAFDAWFERLLHTALALTSAGEFRPFDELAASTLKTMLARTGKRTDPAAVLAEVAKLPAYPDARPAFAKLDDTGATIAVLTNGSEEATRKLLEAAGLEERVVEIVSAADVELYKPHPAVYRHAEERIGLDAKRITLITAHAWDAAGAKQAGWDAVWIDRLEREWPLPKGKPRKPAHNLEQAVQFTIDKL
jgi:2-haloacid dehalogenase